jgi:2-dehydropantoate 2-reductase
MTSKPITRIAILGAGGLGATYASQFYQMDPNSITVIARGERFERLQRDGVFINGHHYQLPVSHPDHSPAPADLIIVALKHHQLLEAIQDMSGFIGEDTIILSVMNGLESENIISDTYNTPPLLLCISMGLAALREENRITFPDPGRLIFGEPINTTPSLRVQRVQAVLKRAGIAYETPEDMLRLMWWKFMINVGTNQPSAVLRAPYGVFQTSKDALALMQTAMLEVIALAEAAGVNLSRNDIDNWYKVLFSLLPYGKTSMLQDIEAGRKTEVEVFGGTVVKLGQKYNIPTPVNETLVRIINVMEQEFTKS